MSVFDLLNPRIRDFLREKGIEGPTPIQEKAIPVILSGKNTLVIAPTGLGKTEAALLPIFHRFLEIKPEEGTSILYITPLRALNRDMLRRTFDMGKYLGIEIAVRHGDTSQAERYRQSKRSPDMLITTPETFHILFMGKRLRGHLSNVKWVIVDEIHELADEERGAQLAVALERLEEICKGSFQRIGLSATVGSPKEVARFLGGVDGGKFRDVEIVNVDVSKNMEIEVELIEKRDKESLAEASVEICKNLIENHKATLLFVNTRDTAEILGSRFHSLYKDFPIEVHHGSLSKLSRIEAEEGFKSGRIKALICTSSLELGIDVGHADFVIQYSSPRQVTRLIQRVGRSGHRMGETSKGKIISLNVEDFAESIVIARKALNRELERMEIRKNPLTVLANQVISIALEYKRIEMDRLFNILKRSYPFSSLDRKVFLDVIKQLEGERRISLENDTIKSRKKSRLYFIDNISMIPDEKSYSVIDITSRKRIGILDESFVIGNIFEGESFILQGRPWKVVGISENEVVVTPVKDIGKIPSWVGEDIPVPFEVAQEVGRLRRELRKGIFKDYPCKEEHISELKKFLDKVGNLEIPDDKTITIETNRNIAVINACFGTKVNETIGRVLSSLLAQRLGESVKMGSDPYRIILEFVRETKAKMIEETLRSVDPDSLEDILKIVLKNTTFIRWYLLHVARKFGAISKDFSEQGAKRLVDIFDGTVVMEEAINKIIWDRMDVKRSKEVLERIRRGEIRLVIQKFSPFSEISQEIARGLSLPRYPEGMILSMLRERLESREIDLVCLNCFNRWRTRVGRVEDRPRCRKCGAIRIGVVTEEIPDLKRRKLSSEERKIIRRLSSSASLVVSHGRFAILTLAGRGIGVTTASRILRNFRFLDLVRSEEERDRLLKEIWKAEVQYARTRGFWD